MVRGIRLSIRTLHFQCRKRSLTLLYPTNINHSRFKKASVTCIKSEETLEMESESQMQMVMDMIDEAAMSGKRQSCRMIY